MPPPPLPVARSSMITSMAKISLLIGAAWLLYALGQAGLVALLPDGAIERTLLRIGVLLPPLLQWCVDHLLALSVLSAVLALLFCVVAWGLLRRREWARLGFVAFLVVTGLGNFASLPLLWQFFETMNLLLPEAIRQTAEGAQLQAELQMGRVVSLATGAATALVFAALHGWIVYQLYRPAIRAEFRA